ncbi:threonine/serine exporter family protein [Carnobacteriaceae bacterium 52-44]
MELLTSKVLDVCTGIGRLMLENGAETYRVEDTVYRVAVNYGMQGVSVFSVPTALIITVQGPTGEEHTRLHRITEQKSNLGIVAEANELSRRIAQTELTPNEALLEIDRLNRMESSYSPFEEFLAIAFICGFFAILFQGDLHDLVAAAITGSIGYIVFLYSKRLTNIRFFSELLGALTIGWVAFILTNLSIGNDINIIIVASIMTLVPGKAITNGIRDLMASHFISGVSVLADALLTASAIGIGVSTVFSFI